jgi:hypothetical protein
MPGFPHHSKYAGGLTPGMIPMLLAIGGVIFLAAFVIVEVL